MPNLKKVLILAYDFPPYVSVGGLRPKAWLDHFKKCGIEPVVITRQWDNKHGNHLDYISASSTTKTLVENSLEGDVIRTPYKPNLSNRLLLKYGESKFQILRKSITGFYEIFQFLLPIGTKRELYLAAKDYISKNKVDCIIATGDPFVLFHYANKLSNTFKIPWIADYRDPWSHDFENHGYLFEKKWNQYLEKKIVPSAKAITTVSELLKLKINDHNGLDNIITIPNGFDSIAIDRISNVHQKSDVLRIGFAGSIFLWNPIESFLSTVSEFINEHTNSEIELYFYGVNIEKELIDLITLKFPKLKKNIQFSPRIPNQELLRHLSECNLLLLFNHYSILGTKIFDYLGLKRKIILCYTDDKDSEELKNKYFHLNEIKSISNQLQADLITETNSGIAVKDGEHLKIVLRELLDEFNTTGQIACNSINSENYSRKIQTEKLANLIKSIC